MLDCVSGSINVKKYLFVNLVFISCFSFVAPSYATKHMILKEFLDSRERARQRKARAASPCNNDKDEAVSEKKKDEKRPLSKRDTQQEVTLFSLGSTAGQALDILEKRGYDPY